MAAKRKRGLSAKPKIKRRCQYGVNKITKACLKHPRRRKRPRR